MDSHGTGKILVDWTKFVITKDTVIDEGAGMLVPYAIVRVDAERGDHTLTATKITVLAEAPGEVRFEGGRITVLALDEYLVKVCGTKFTTNADTRIDDGLSVGSLVRVDAMRVDGKLIATRITLLEDLE